MDVLGQRKTVWRHTLRVHVCPAVLKVCSELPTTPLSHAAFAGLSPAGDKVDCLRYNIRSETKRNLEIKQNNNNNKNASNMLSWLVLFFCLRITAGWSLQPMCWRWDTHVSNVGQVTGTIFRTWNVAEYRGRVHYVFFQQTPPPWGSLPCPISQSQSVTGDTNCELGRDHGWMWFANPDEVSYERTTLTRSAMGHQPWRS